MHLAVSNRPDIAYAVSNLTGFNSSPQKVYWTILKQELRYLKYMTNKGILYKLNSCNHYGDALETSQTESQLQTMSISWNSRNSVVHSRNLVCQPIRSVQECIWQRQLEAELVLKNQHQVLNKQSIIDYNGQKTLFRGLIRS